MVLYDCARQFSGSLFLSGRIPFVMLEPAVQPPQSSSQMDGILWHSLDGIEVNQNITDGKALALLALSPISNQRSFSLIRCEHPCHRAKTSNNKWRLISP